MGGGLRICVDCVTENSEAGLSSCICASAMRSESAKKVNNDTSKTILHVVTTSPFGATVLFILTTALSLLLLNSDDCDNLHNPLRAPKKQVHLSQYAP